MNSEKPREDGRHPRAKEENNGGSWRSRCHAVPAREIAPFNAWYADLDMQVCDPTIVWGTDVDCERMTQFLAECNEHAAMLVSPAHLLVKAVGTALRRHPQFNRRVVARRLYQLPDANVLMPIRHARERWAEVVLLRNVETRSLSDLARELWERGRESARGDFWYDPQVRLYRLLPHAVRGPALRFKCWLQNRFRLPVHQGNEREQCAAAVVNYLGFQGAPPLRAFKPSRFPSGAQSLNVTMGCAEQRPVVAADGSVVARRVAPLFVRGDHRLVDAYELAQFVETLRELLEHPRRWADDEQPNNASPIPEAATRIA